MPTFSNAKILEASGICRDVGSNGLYWVHNDSGNAPVVYQTTDDGMDVASFLLPIKTIDIEDCSCEMVNGVNTLILADVGDNNCTRTSYKIFVVDVSSLPKQTKSISTIEFTYPDGKKRNCESCALLPNGKIVLVTKCYPTISGKTQVFTIESHLSGASGVFVTAGPVLNANLGIIMGMDYSAERKEFMLLGNGRLHFFAEGDWFREIKNVIHPKINQPEGCCYGHVGGSAVVVGEAVKGSGKTSEIVTAPI